MIQVVSAVIIRKDRILLTQRREDKDFPFTWECPGGKVDGEETHVQAIEREVEEELDVVVFDPRLLWSGKFSLDDKHPDVPNLQLSMYVCHISIQKPIPAEGQGIGWFTAHEMRQLALAPGNKAALHAILETMNRQERAS